MEPAGETMDRIGVQTPEAAAGLAGVAAPAVLLAAIIVAGAAAAHFAGPALLHWLDLVRGLGLFGVVLLWTLTVLVAMAGFVPASMMGAVAGLVYGDAFGFVLSASAIMTGAAAALALVRMGARDRIAGRIGRHQRLARFEAAIVRDGWRFVGLLRLSPVMPFSLASYALALTRVSFRDYMLGTAASLPALLLYVMAGHAGAATPGPIRLTLLAAGAAATIWLGWRSARILAGR